MTIKVKPEEEENIEYILNGIWEYKFFYNVLSFFLPKHVLQMRFNDFKPFFIPILLIFLHNFFRFKKNKLYCLITNEKNTEIE